MIITKSVLLFGVLAFAALLVFRLPVFDVFYVIPGAPPKPALFDGLGPAVRFWIALLAVALVLDYVSSRRARKEVQPFASALNPGQPPEDDAVTQVTEGSVLTTSASGGLDDRLVTVTLREARGTRTGPIFRVDVACDCPWTLDIRRRSIGARLLGWAGAVVATGDAELDAVVVVQGDDEEAIRRWLTQPTVRNGLLALFQQHKIGSLSLCDGGSVLRAELVTHSSFVQPRRDADAAVKELSALARTLERR